MTATVDEHLTDEQRQLLLNALLVAFAHADSDERRDGLLALIRLVEGVDTVIIARRAMRRIVHAPTVREIRKERRRMRLRQEADET